MAEQTYDFTAIEKAWQRQWAESRLYEAPDQPDPAKSFYMLVMFAYPSGDIHMGHFRNYIIGDAVARKQLMLGKAVLHPFGWDAFGLPAERAAIKRGVHPADWTNQNIAMSRATLQEAGISFDWSREVASCDPDYYKWTQWLFTQFFKKGLAIQKKTWVNWDPIDKTVLANEQVKDGIAERSGAKVEKKELVGWYFAITKYADRLIDDLEQLPGWPDAVRRMQTEWIGRSYGLEVDFTVEETGEKLPIYTTRPDTIYGATFMVVAPESELIDRLGLTGDDLERVTAYRQQALTKSEIDRTAAGEKDGVFTGKYVINPYNGERVPLWVADYVLAHYGTGAIMAVPAHDERDFAFARKYGLPLKLVIRPKADVSLVISEMDDAYAGPGFIENSGQFDGIPAGEEAINAFSTYAESEGFGRRRTNFKLKDWSISRQRYWGCPIPIIHCPKCGPQAVPDDQLPVVLPRVESYMPKGRSPLADVPEFLNTTCPKCGGPAERDADTMDTFVCSSWYFLRYIDPKNETALANWDQVKAWMPIDLYIGGITHATGHLIYFRFFTKVLKDLGYLDFDEPATRLFNHGMVMDAEGEVMSKSKGNVVSPIELMRTRGIDVSRLAMFFTAPSEMPVLWSDDSVTGVEKFTHNRFWPLAESYRGTTDALKQSLSRDGLSGYERDIYVKLNQTIKRVDEDSEKLQFNTCIAALMELVREYDASKISSDTLNDRVILTAIQLIAPMAPHLAEELWQRCGQEGSVFRSAWPSADPEALTGDQVTIAVQVNGKLRDTIAVAADAGQGDIEAVALGSSRVQQHTDGKAVVKKIYVPGRLLNIVVKG